jgi:hypothetical protein
MCEQLLTFSQAQDLLVTHGLTPWRSRLLLQTGQIPDHPHRLHRHRRWRKALVKEWLDNALKAPQPRPDIPGEECERPPGTLSPRS